MESFESAGQWWLPEHHEFRTVGILRYTPDDGFRLEIPFGALGGMEGLVDRMNEGRSTPLVYGVLRDGRAVTLVNAAMTGTTISAPGAPKEEHWAMRGHVGRTHCIGDPLIDRVVVRYAHLRDWVALNPSNFVRPVENTGASEDIQYRYTSPPDQMIAAGPGWKLSLAHVSRHTGVSVRGFNLEHDCELIVELDTPTAFSVIDSNLLGHLWLYLSFCMDHWIHATSLRVRLSSEKEWLEVGGAQTLDPKFDNTLIEPFMLLSFSKVKEDLQRHFSQWISFAPDERRAASLLIGLSSPRSLPSDLKFLAAAQALEALSRVDANEYELDETEFKRRTKEVLSSVSDKKTKDWLKRKLRYANQRSAAELLRQLADYVGDYVSVLAPETDRFLDDIRDNRNFYSHRDDRRVDRILDLGNLLVLTQGVICFLKAVMLRRMGYSPRATQTILDDCQGPLRWRKEVANLYLHDKARA